MDSEVKTLRKWENFADAYENSFEIYSKIVFTQFLPLLHLQVSEKVLDAGCGSGIGIEILQQQCLNLEIYGIDLAKSMIAKAHAKPGMENSIITVGNLTNLPYPSSFFDKYISNFSLQVVANWEKMLQEAYRVLTPSGTSIFSYPKIKEKNDILSIFHKALRTVKIGPKQQNAFKFIKGMEKIGFQTRYFDCSLGMDFANGKQASEFIKPLKELAKLMGTEKYEKVLEIVEEKARFCISSGMQIVLEVRVVIACKA